VGAGDSWLGLSFLALMSGFDVWLSLVGIGLVFEMGEFFSIEMGGIDWGRVFRRSNSIIALRVAA
jgi:hypothetical protein